MKKKLKLLLAVLLAAFLVVGASIATAEEEEENNGVVVQAPTNDAGTIYERYQDNSFQLLTKEATSLTGLKAAIQNSTGIVKELVWSGVMNLGKFNTSLVKYMFSFDMEKPIKKPMLNITADLASGMLSIASSIGILSVGIVMILKFIAEQNIKGVVKIFFTTIGIFFSLIILSNSTRTDHVSTYIVDADNLVESTFITINPVFTAEGEAAPEQNVPGSEVSGEKNYLEDAGNLIAAKIFKSSVYEPYLIFNYGTSNTETIRRKTVEYKGVEYDRIGILLDNDFDDSGSDEIYTKVTEYESETLKNKTISWKNNMSLAMQGLFYLLLNLAQTIIYFALCVVRLILVFIRWLLFPMLPMMLIMGLFNFQINVFKNGAKAFVTVIGLKGLVSFALVFVASYMSLGYNIASDIDDPFQKIITILVFLCMPVGAYFFRHIIGKMLTGNLSLSDIGNLTRHPFRTATIMRKAGKKQAKAARQQRKNDRKQRKQDKKDREEEKERKQHNDFKNPKSSKSKRSDKRSTENDQKQSEKTPEDNVGAYRRYRPSKSAEPDKKTSKERKESFSARRTRRPAPEGHGSSQTNGAKTSQKKTGNARNKWNKMHEDSRYDDLVAQRNVPERQRIKKQAQKRQMKRQQEQMRVASVGRSPRRSGQSTQATSGEFRQIATNSRRSAGKQYSQSVPVQEVVVESKKRQTGHSNVTISARKRVVKQPVQKADVVKKGVRRRRV